MPKITIREKDITMNPAYDNTAFAVVVPGFFRKNKPSSAYNDPTKVFDDNGVFEVSDQAEFVEKIGKIPASKFTATYEETVTDQPTVETGETTEAIASAVTEPKSVDVSAHYGNQIAYELLGLGYTILYVNLGEVKINSNEIVGGETAAKNYENLTSANCTLFDALKDKANYRFRYLITGLLTNNTQANLNIQKIAGRNEDASNELTNGRGDCIALIDIGDDIYNTDADSQATIIKEIAQEANNYSKADYGKYSAIFAPSLCLDIEKDDEYGNNNKFPASFYYLACSAYARNYGNFAEWYAAAGLTRGVCKYDIDGTNVKLGESAVFQLEGRTPQNIGQLDDKAISADTAVNLIIKIRNGYYLWGNRTAHKLSDEDLTASHFLNIRQLCCTLKKDIYDACKKFTFDPNGDILWVNFCNAIRPTLEKMKADQGIRDYTIIKAESAKRATLTAVVRIVPIEAVEDFDITVTLEDSLGNANATVSE